MSKGIKEFGKLLGNIKTLGELAKQRKTIANLNKLSWQISQLKTREAVSKVLTAHDPHALFTLEESLQEDNKFALILASEHRQLLKDLLKLFGAPIDTLKDVDKGVQFFEAGDDWGKNAHVSIRDFGDAIGLEFGEFFNVPLSADILRKQTAKIKTNAKRWQIN